jgi:hypothetical protein
MARPVGAEVEDWGGCYTDNGDVYSAIIVCPALHGWRRFDFPQEGLVTYDVGEGKLQVEKCTVYRRWPLAGLVEQINSNDTHLVGSILRHAHACEVILANYRNYKKWVVNKRMMSA